MNVYLHLCSTCECVCVLGGVNSSWLWFMHSFWWNLQWNENNAAAINTITKWISTNSMHVCNEEKILALSRDTHDDKKKIHFWLSQMFHFFLFIFRQCLDVDFNIFIYIIQEILQTNGKTAPHFGMIDVRYGLYFTSLWHRHC